MAAERDDPSVKVGHFLHAGKSLRLPVSRLLPDQATALHAALAGEDVVHVGRMGTGKSTAAAIAVAVAMQGHDAGPVRAVWVTPTRELANAAYRTLTHAAAGSDLVVSVVTGGMPPSVVRARTVDAKADVLAVTPGALAAMLEPEELSYRGAFAVQVLVIDEADRVFELGYEMHIQTIVEQLSGRTQTILTATTPPVAAAACVTDPCVVGTADVDAFKGHAPAPNPPSPAVVPAESAAGTHGRATDPTSGSDGTDAFGAGAGSGAPAAGSTGAGATEGGGTGSAIDVGHGGGADSSAASASTAADERAVAAAAAALKSPPEWSSLPISFESATEYETKFPRLIAYQGGPLRATCRGDNVVNVGPPACGKTTAAAIALTEAVLPHADEDGIKGVFVVPTHQLAREATAQLSQVSSHTRLSIVAMAPGQSAEEEDTHILRHRPDVIVGTPRVIATLLRRSSAVHAFNVKMLVIDDAASIFDADRTRQLTFISGECCHRSQTYVTGASIPGRAASWVIREVPDPCVFNTDAAAVRGHEPPADDVDGDAVVFAEPTPEEDPEEVDATAGAAAPARGGDSRAEAARARAEQSRLVEAALSAPVLSTRSLAATYIGGDASVRADALWALSYLSDEAPLPPPAAPAAPRFGHAAALAPTGTSHTSAALPFGLGAGALGRSPWEDIGCTVCGSDDIGETVLLCDGCDKPYHMRCHRPPVLNIPEGDWHCSSCCDVHSRRARAVGVAATRSRMAGLMTRAARRTTERGGVTLIDGTVLSRDSRGVLRASGRGGGDDGVESGSSAGASAGAGASDGAGAAAATNTDDGTDEGADAAATTRATVAAAAAGATDTPPSLSEAQLATSMAGASTTRAASLFAQWHAAAAERPAFAAALPMAALFAVVRARRDAILADTSSNNSSSSGGGSSGGGGGVVDAGASSGAVPSDAWSRDAARAFGALVAQWRRARAELGLVD